MRSKLKRIVISERNYLALKRLGYAGDSFNDVISKLLRIERSYQEMKKQQEEQQQESADENNSTSSYRLPFPGSLSELFNEHDRRQLADLLGWGRMRSTIKGND
jgi:predicted CopG family antitoxin